jgi:hypothetical protein
LPLLIACAPLRTWSVMSCKYANGAHNSKRIRPCSSKKPYRAVFPLR